MRPHDTWAALTGLHLPRPPPLSECGWLSPGLPAPHQPGHALCLTAVGETNRMLSVCIRMHVSKLATLCPTCRGLQSGCIDEWRVGLLTLLSRSSRRVFSSWHCAASARAAANAPESSTCPMGCPHAFPCTADALALQTFATRLSHLGYLAAHSLDSPQVSGKAGISGMHVCSTTQGRLGNVQRALTQIGEMLCWKLPCCYLHLAPEAGALPVALMALRSVQAAGCDAPRQALQAKSRHMQTLPSCT